MEGQLRSGGRETAVPPMEDRIREWAKKVHGVLEDSGPMTLAALARRIRALPTNDIAVAIGWLAHAASIQFREAGTRWEVAIAPPAAAGTGPAHGSPGVPENNGLGLGAAVP